MSQDLIHEYKKTLLLKFQNEEMEDKYREAQYTRGRSSSVFAFGALFGIFIAFAYLELRAFGRETSLPMYGFLLTAAIALGNMLTSHFCLNQYRLSLRLLGNGVLGACVVMAAVYLQKYSAYHTIEMALILRWLGSLNTVRFLFTTLLNLVMTATFMAVMYITDVSEFWITLVFVLLLVASLMGGYLSYLYERQRRLLFMQSTINESMKTRQELWSFTLFDLDMALSGILEFKEMIGVLKKYLEPVIEFESYILTAMEGKAVKPTADKIEGKLFENEDKTLWSEDLVNKLAQTRQATVSAESEEIKGIFGIKKKKFLSYRLDVPVFSDSKMMGIIGLRRSTRPFDDLDMIASVSLATQAMLIFKRSARTSALIVDSTVPDPVVRAPDMTLSSKMAITQSTDMEMTDHNISEPDEIVASSAMLKKIKKDEESAKKTITLLSRENADKIALDRYRSASLGGDPLSVLIVEVDGLSKLREQDGDQVAYKVFAAIVKYIFSRVNKNKDVLGRYGQNGLSILLSEIDMNAAEKFAESIREFVERARYKTAFGEKGATLSIGVAAITDDTGDYHSMIKRADMALFVAKKNGRNCVKVRL